ncbi:Myosin head (motor domain) family protein [Brugia pahangi]
MVRFKVFTLASKVIIPELNTIFDVIAAILHLGNIHFIENVEDTKGGCLIKPSSKVSFAASLENAASLFGLEDYELKNGLTTRVVQLAKGGVRGTNIRLDTVKSHDASAARDALAKEKKKKKSKI